jgi:hypothetical protein
LSYHFARVATDQTVVQKFPAVASIALSNAATGDNAIMAIYTLLRPASRRSSYHQGKIETQDQRRIQYHYYQLTTKTPPGVLTAMPTDNSSLRKELGKKSFGKSFNNYGDEVEANDTKDKSGWAGLREAQKIKNQPKDSKPRKELSEKNWTAWKDLDRAGIEGKDWQYPPSDPRHTRYGDQYNEAGVWKGKGKAKVGGVKKGRG